MRVGRGLGEREELKMEHTEIVGNLKYERVEDT